MSDLTTSLQAGLDALRQLPQAYPVLFAWYTLILRFLFPVLAVLMLARIIRGLVKASPKPEVWAYLSLPNGAAEPPDPLGEYSGPRLRLRCAAQLPCGLPAARRPHSRSG